VTRLPSLFGGGGGLLSVFRVYFPFLTCFLILISGAIDFNAGSGDSLSMITSGLVGRLSSFPIDLCVRGFLPFAVLPAVWG